MKSAIFAILLGTTALVTNSASAQTSTEASPPEARPQGEPTQPVPPATPPQPGPTAQPEPPAAPTQAAQPTQPAQPVEQAAAQPVRRGPANICQELVAFLRQPAPAAPGAPAPQAASQSAPPAQAAQSAAPPTSGQSSSPVPQGTAAPAVEAQKAPPAPQATTAPQVSGQTAPIPQSPKAENSPRIPVEQAESMAQANDIAGCRDAAQRMRRAGLTMPPGLIALAGLRLDLLQAGQQP
jgi:hypothetical protein